MDEISPSTNQTGPKSSERKCYKVVALCLGPLSVFLMVGLIALGVNHYYSVHAATTKMTELLQANKNLTEERDELNAGLSSMTKERNELKAGLSSLSVERDELKAGLSSMTKERDDLKAGLSSMTKERDELNVTLTEEQNKLPSLSMQKKTCPAGWKIFSCSCYFLSTESGSWTKGRDDCRTRGADLVVIDSDEEQNFLSGFTKERTWIGLSDRDTEGTWKWVDGSPLTLKYWFLNQPNNGNGDPRLGEEDCGHIWADKTSDWNDLSCEASLPWVCEKNPEP